MTRAEVNRQRRQLVRLADCQRRQLVKGTLVSLRGSPKAAPINQLRAKLVAKRVWGRVVAGLEPQTREVVRWSLGAVRPNLRNAAATILAAMGGK